MIVNNIWLFIEAYVVAQFFIISIATKVLDARQVIEWICQNLTKGSVLSAKIVYTLILAFELAACGIAVFLGGEHGLIPVILIASAVGLSLASKIIFKKSEGCPCFGLASMNSGLDARNISIALALIVSGLYTTSSLFKHIASESLAIALIGILGTSIFFVSSAVQKKMLYGSRYALKKMLKSPTDASEIERPAAVVFLSAHCTVCISFLKYIEEFSKLYAKHVHIYLSVYGYGLSERAKFGEAILLANSDEHLGQVYGVKNVPTLVLLQDDGQIIKFRGIDACGLALTRIAYAGAFRQLSGQQTSK